MLPFLGEAIPTLNDARERFLAPDGHMIPARDVLMAGVVETPKQYAWLTKPWKRNGFDFSASLPIVLNSFYRARMETQRFLSACRSWCTLDYTCRAEPSAAASLLLPVVCEGTGHGLALWFETTLIDDIGYSTEPEYPENISGRAFLPWLEPVPLFAGDEVHVELHADLIGSDYVWRWNTQVPPRASRKEISFQQSTFYGGAFFHASLRKRDAEFSPELSAEGQADLFLLQSMDGRASLQQIAESAAERFPNVYGRWEDAFRRLVEIADRFSR